MAVRMKWVVCPACGKGHTFSLPAEGVSTLAYGYQCPETGLRAAIGARGPWELVEQPSQGAVSLSPIKTAAGVGAS